jgi:ATP-dependent protease HslVU (ClpYQ) peptidase subunit
VSVIAWDGKTLAADKRCGTELPRTVTKIRRTATGALIGCTGSACSDMELMAWYEDGAKVADFPPTQRNSATSSHLIAIEPGGVVRMFMDCPHGRIYEDGQHAIGSGRDFAMAAMHLGRNAVEAVAVAIALTATCGNGIDSLELGDAP